MSNGDALTTTVKELAKTIWLEKVVPAPRQPKNAQWAVIVLKGSIQM